MTDVSQNLYFASLGCSKNLVDAQVMLGKMDQKGYQIVTDPAQAGVIVVNTCSFIDAAKQESIDTVLELADFKDPEQGSCHTLIMSGCMAQRYYRELEEEMPEVDLFIGTGEYHKITSLLDGLEQGTLEKKSFVEIPKFIHTELDPRLNTSPNYMAWLKVSEGCNRNCTFCIIPTLRGRLRSRSIDSLVQETKNLVASGVKEINIISQDLSDYGTDLPEGEDLYHLLQKLEEIENLQWVRLFYYYPDDFDPRVIEFMGKSKKICPYLDMPLQHFSEKMLRRMNRRLTEFEIEEKIQYLREKVPNVTIRTSVIVGFPGETEEDFEKLVEGIKKFRFDHLGVFKYSDEEGTPAYRLEPKIDQEVIDERFETIYKIQEEIASQRNSSKLGETISVLVEGPHEETSMLLQGRHIGQAPEIDGNVIINDGIAKAGDIVQVKITDAFKHDLVGEIVSE